MKLRLLIFGTLLTLLVWLSWGAVASKAAPVDISSDSGWFGSFFTPKQLSQLERARLGAMLPYRPVVVSPQKRLVGMPILKRPDEGVPSPDELVGSGARIPLRPRRISSQSSDTDLQLVMDE